MSASTVRAGRMTALVIGTAMVAAACGGAGALQIRPERLYERSPVEDARYQVVSKLDVRRSSFGFFGFPVSIPNMVAVVDSAVQEANADAVTNVEVETQVKAFFFLVGLTSYRVRGDLIRFEEQK